MEIASIAPAATSTAHDAASGHTVSRPQPSEASRITTPNAMTHTAHPATAIAHALPCRCNRTSGPDSNPANTEPAASAAVNNPTVNWSPPNTVAPSTGNNARGIAKNIAAMSSRNVMRRLGRVARNRKPSTTERNPARGPTPSGGRDGNRYMAHRLAMKVRASTV